ncbi:uncharacterized protein K02A2.6-like [Saccostrea cucullata]|uniref:uncharacterized protein K02A2.6-like n=1 Tax=Saccostrea cuccullata TaxID=36930 RepID=UPI002ED4A42F
MDFCGPFPSGSYLMVVVDDYSRYPVVEILSRLTAKAVIPKLDNVFALFGIPDVVKTDNGPPFNGSLFKEFAKHLGFQHRKITPLWPQANGEAERFMKTIGKAIRAAHAEHRSWKQKLYCFLRNYRATPHATTSATPAELLLGRKLKTRIPEIIPSSKNTEISRKDQKEKEKMKRYADIRRGALDHKLQPGDKVLVKQQKQDKLSTPYSPEPYEVVKQKGSMITAKNDNKEVTRNASFFKKINEHERSAEVTDDSSDELITAQPEPRRSTRERRPPAHLKDYVCAQCEDL